MFQYGKKSFWGTFCVAAVLLFTACDKQYHVADQGLGGSTNIQSGKDEIDSEAEVAAANTDVSGWSKTSKWIHNEFEEYFVNNPDPNIRRGYAQCPLNVGDGVVCSNSGYNCQAGYAPTAAVFNCQTSYEVHGRVQDIQTGAPIAGATVIFHTGGPVNPWEKIKLVSDANGEFTLVVGGQPALAMALKAGYSNGYDVTDSYARAAVISGLKTVIPMRQVLK